MDPISPKSRILNVAQRLAALCRRFDDRRDHLATFAFTYGMMTQRIAEEIGTAGFQDPAWVAEMVEKFSARFFAAHEAREAGRPVPEGWRPVLDAFASRRTSVLEEMILGMAAHIVFDLPQAVIDATAGGAQLTSRIADHHRMNDVLGRSIDPIQAAVAAKYAPYLQWLDVFTNRQDEILTNFGIRVARGMAWYNAQRLLDPAQSEAAAKSIAKSTQAIVRDVLDPPMFGKAVRFLRWLASFLRRWPARNPS